MTFEDFVRTAAGHAPYPYQTRLAAEGLPELLSVPTGSGKTLAATLPWLWRRRQHPDPDVRRSTPRRLVLVLPQRGLVEQTHTAVAGWLEALGLADEVGLHLLLGGASTDDRAWKTAPEHDTVMVGTQDMVLSRLLMRGYGESRAAWPMSFGLLHSDTQFVVDEVQLMGPGLPTSLQLEGLRRALGTAAPSRTMWMSATVDRDALTTVDFAGPATEVALTDDDRTGPLGRRLAATRTVRRLDTDGDSKVYARTLASAVARSHRPGTRTLVVLNTVSRARDVHAALTKGHPELPCTLLHSRFRPPERRDQVRAAVLEPVDPAGPGLVVVTTQVLEAGIDVTSAVLVTELAPWSSIVQRAGRCNRGGEHDDAELRWVRPPGSRGWSAPYEEADLDATQTALNALEGRGVTSGGLALDVPQTSPLHQVLRRRDLVDLFDTAPDLSGNDIDISRWVRDADERTCLVAWRAVAGTGPQDDEPPLHRDELCPVPLVELRAFLDAPGRAHAWTRRQPDGTWSPARDGLRPGLLVLLDAAAGGYTSGTGWSPASAADVAPVALTDLDHAGDDPDAMGVDDRVLLGQAVTLAQHGRDVRDEAARLLGGLAPMPGLADTHAATVCAAGFLHDVGKAHPAFADALLRAGAPAEGGPWAKSGGRGRLRHDPRYFRHELASALMVVNPRSPLLRDEPEPDLVAYLVAAHHGKVRLSVRSVEGESEHMLGIGEADETPAVDLGQGWNIPALTLDRGVLRLGSGEGGSSWTARACALRDRADLGPFRLAFLEAVVRVADWNASASYDDAAEATG